MPKLALVLAMLAFAAAALPATSLAKPSHATRAALPLHGVLVPGRSLAGVRLGDTPQRVLAVWGDNYRVCDGCSSPTWYFGFDQDDPAHRGIGAGVVFRAGHAVAVFTLGTPLGWKTSDGLQLGALLTRVDDVYESLQWKPCIGYIAMTMRTGGSVTSIYTDGNSVYGFALTHPSQPVCQ